jgi:hypothetical protein
MRMELWTTPDRTRWFVVPSQSEIGDGAFVIHDLKDASRSVDPMALIPFELTEHQARRFAKEELGKSLEELRGVIDTKLADLRQQLDEFNRTPVAEGTTITPNAASALFDFVKALPRVVGGSISGDEERVASAHEAMERLQQQLKESGIDVDDRVKNFPDRLADLRRKPSE